MSMTEGFCKNSAPGPPLMASGVDGGGHAGMAPLLVASCKSQQLPLVLKHY